MTRRKAPPRHTELPKLERKHHHARRKPRRRQQAETTVQGPGFEIRQCDAFEGLKGASFDHAILDPPFSARTHAGQQHGRRSGPDGDDTNPDWTSEAGLGYEHLTEPDVVRLCHLLHAAADGWIVAMTDHVLFPTWERALKDLGRYVFAPVPVVIPGMNVRLAGDGPSNWTIWLVVARPRGLKDGTKPGAYLRPIVDARTTGRVKGSKPYGLMDQIVRDYSRLGDVICDPFLGSGTTGVAAVRNHREFIGFETNPATFALAAERLRTAKPPLFTRPLPPLIHQESLL